MVFLIYWPCMDFNLMEMILKIEYLFFYWALAHPIIILGRRIQCDFDNIQWVQIAVFACNIGV